MALRPPLDRHMPSSSSGRSKVESSSIASSAARASLRAARSMLSEALPALRALTAERNACGGRCGSDNVCVSEQEPWEARRAVTQKRSRNRDQLTHAAHELVYCRVVELRLDDVELAPQLREDRIAVLEAVRCDERNARAGHGIVGESPIVLVGLVQCASAQCCAAKRWLRGGLRA